MEESGIVGLEDTQARTAMVFPAFGEFEKARLLLDSLGLRYGIISPEPGYALAGAPALISDLEGLAAVHDASFAGRLWNGTAAPSECPPLYSREYSNLRDPLAELCSACGVLEQGGPG